MKSVALALVLAALLLSLLSLQAWDASPWLYAPIAVSIGILGASCLQGGVSWISVVLGALSPLLFRWLHPFAPWLAVAALCLLWTMPRVWLARTRGALFALGGAGLALSLLAGWIAAHFSHEGVLQTLAACIFSGAALSLVSLIVRTNTPIAHALDVTARVLADSPARDAIVRAADVHRTRYTGRVRDALPGSRWHKLVHLADHLATLQRDDTTSESARNECSQAVITLAGSLSSDSPAITTAAPAETPPVANVGPAAKPPPTTPETTAADDIARTALPDTVIPSQSAATAVPPDHESPLDPQLVVNATVP